jgi:hypothetical protein
VKKYPSTSLPQTNDPKDIQRAVLDLLDKINRLSGDMTGWGFKNTLIETLVSAYDPPSAANPYVVTVNSVPVGTTAIFGYANMGSATTAGRGFTIRDMDGIIWLNFANPTTAIRGYGWFEVPLDSQRRFNWTVTSADVSIVNIYMRGFYYPVKLL